MRDLTTPDLSPALATPFSLIEHAFRRLTNLVKEMSHAELEYRGPDGTINSTATLLAHLAHTDLEYFHQIMGMPIPPELEAEYGPGRAPDDTLPVVTGQTATELLARYRDVLDLVRSYLMTQTDSDALRSVTIPWWPEPATVRYVLWHIAGHSMFHQGQITRLRLWYEERGA